MYDLLAFGFLAYGTTLLLTKNGWRVHVAMAVFYFVLVFGASVMFEKKQLGRILTKASSLTESYAQERQALAKKVLLLSTQQFAMSPRLESDILALVERQAIAAIPTGVHAMAQSEAQLGDAERLVEVTLAISSAKKKMAEIRAEFDSLPEAFERNSVLHAHAYWAIEDVLGISLTLPRAFPVWPEPKSAPAEVKL